MAILEVSNLGKSFGSTEVLKDISFSLEKGIPGHHRFIRQRQNHPAALSQLPGNTGQRHNQGKR